MARTKPRKQPRTDAPARPSRTDGWDNLWTGLGTSRDRRTGTRVSVQRLSWQGCEALYQGDDVAAKIVDEPAQEMVRKWIDVAVSGKSGEASKDVSEAIADRLEELQAQERFFDALRWERAFGGSAILPMIDDGVLDQALPVREDSVRSIRGIAVLDRSELWPATYYTDPREPKCGEVETYMITRWGPGAVARTSVRVHETRVIKFRGIQVSKLHAMRENDWGDSVFVRVLQVMSDFGMAWGGGAHLLSDFSQAVFRIKGLADAIAAGQEDLIRKRIEQIEIGRSMVRAALIDAGDSEVGDPGESYERKATPLSGYPEMLDRFCQRLAAAADMPVSRLFGVANGGLGSDDKAGDTWWTQRIAGQQQTKLRRPLERVVRLLLLEKEGPTKGKEPERWSIEFRPLRQLDPLQEAQRRAANAQADAAYVQAQVLTPEEVAMARFGGDRYGEEIIIDTELRAKMAEEAPEVPEEPAEEIPPKGQQAVAEELSESE